MSYVRLDTGNRWRRQQTQIATASRAAKLKYLPVNKLMAHVTGASGVLRKSTDSGRTWTNATMLSGTTACLDVCEDPDGNIWGLFVAAGTAKVGMSANAMVSWTLKHTHTASLEAYNIACSPTRAAESTVGFTSRSADDEATVILSTDSGGTWATKLTGYRLVADLDEPLIQFLPGKINVLLRGRFIPPFAPAIWDAIATQDTRFVNKWGNGWADPGIGGAGELNPDTDRAVIVLASASGDPALSVSGATSTLLGAWDSPTPANFGGDGHAWWRAYYIEPTADFIDFTGTTGVLRNVTFFRNTADLVSVARTWVHDLEYHGSGVGTKIEIATASQATQYGDVLWNWIDHYERSIDDLTYEKEFNGPFFNHDYTRHNSAFIPLTPGGGADSSIDWYLDEENDEDSHSNTMVFTGTAVADPDIFPNSVRVLVVTNTLRLRGLRDATEDVAESTFAIASGDNGATWLETYENTDAPLPVELIRYGDTSPSFGAVADPNKVIRSTGGTWAVFDDPLTAGGETHDLASLAYDLITDRLFVSYIGSTRIFALLHASTADAAQANSAVAAKSDVIFDEGAAPYWQVIPRTEAAAVAYRQLISNKKTRVA